MECSTRLARNNDLQVLALFERELARLAFPDDPIEDLQYHTRKLRRALNTEPEGMVVIAATDDPCSIVGWLWLTTKTTLATGERYGVLRSLFVLPSHRRRGLGLLLAEYAARYFEERGVSRTVAKIAHDDLAAEKLLHRVGFRPLHLTLERT
jgi:L-amino acid N-acyltransferase YncA